MFPTMSFFGSGVVGLPAYIALLFLTALLLFFLLRVVLRHMSNPSSVDELRKRRMQQARGATAPSRNGRNGGRSESSPVNVGENSGESDRRRHIDHSNRQANNVEQSESSTLPASRNEEALEEEEGVRGAICRARRRRLEREAMKRERELKSRADDDSDSDSIDGSRRHRDERRYGSYKQRQLEREQRERERERQRRAELMAKKKAEDEEYRQWKEQFSVDDEGDVEIVKEDSQTLLQQFLNYAKARKVVQLDEIAAEFGLKTSQVLNRLSELESLGFIDGILDDRGRYICVEKEEWEAVGAYINSAGRVTKSEDLVKACNRLIRLRPTDQDKSQFELEKREALSRLVDFEAVAAEAK